MIDPLEIKIIQLLTEYGMNVKQIEIAINLKEIDEQEIEKSFGFLTESITKKVENISNKFEQIITDYKN